MLQILELQEYRVNLIMGMMASIGSLSEHLVRHSTASLLSYLGDGECNESLSRISLFLETLLGVFHIQPKLDRLAVPFLELLDLFFSNPHLIKAEHEPIYLSLLKHVNQIVFKVKDAKKLMAGLKVYSGMANLEEAKELHEAVTKKLIGYLSHPFPLIRRTTAEHLYLLFSSLMDPYTNSEEVEQLLLETNW
jgi:hypothetical protein